MVSLKILISTMTSYTIPQARLIRKFPRLTHLS